ncbi:hypothetical protein [Marinimicrobium sp. ABcell2]|uniref:hypothetical protein n=1 Tax=Marinimicrobium sp. ABcell2 TaxID=3069751 RepID=UPI0027B5BF95|nr:hypothetical protein [Marinimicrobium sp. ABcell2]MDQ2076830.1 hypothetical protein [Marinimicrobium sp. ABcell2]
MLNHLWSVLALLTLALAFRHESASAHEEIVAPLSKLETVYSAPAPLDDIRVTYIIDSRSHATLTVESRLFSTRVSATGLADLPRPDWGSMQVYYSLMSRKEERWEDKPYVSVRVPLHGPTGQAWELTWATFIIDADSSAKRYLYYFIPDESTNSARSRRKEWPIGSGVSAESLREFTPDP